MDHTVHRGSSAALAVAVAGAGLIAVAPLAPIPGDMHPVRQIDVQLTTDDLFTALGESFMWAGNQLAQGLTDLFQLDLPGVAANLTSAVANVGVLVPENLLLSLLGGPYMTQAIEFAPVTSWLDLSQNLDQLFTSITSLFDIGVQDILQGHLADGVVLLLSSLNGLVFDLPEQLLVGVPALLGDQLLGLVGL